MIEIDDLPIRLHGRRAAVAACLLDGLENKEIARAVDMPLHAVGRELKRLCAIFGARNRVHLAVLLVAAS